MLARSGEECEALPASGVLALLCLALISAESMLVISGCPVLFICEPLKEVVGAKLDDTEPVLAKSE